MTRPVRSGGVHRSALPARSRRLGAALANLPRQARADLWPLIVTVALTAVIVAGADAGPRLLTATADETVRTTVDQSPHTALTVTSPFPDDFRVDGRRPTETATRVRDTARQIDEALPTGLASLFAAPVVTVSTIRLPLTVPDGHNEASLRLAYVWDGAEASVEWAEGGPPGGADPAALWSDDGTWPVQVAISTDAAAVLRIGAGDRIDVSDAGRTPLDVTVSGVFRATDVHDAVWSQVPDLLSPQTRGSGFTTRTEIAAYVSEQSLPDARMALDPPQTTTTYTLAATSSALSYHRLGSSVAQISKLEATPTSLGLTDPGVRVTSGLDQALLSAQARITAGGAQAAVLLVGLIATGTVLLLLAADVLTRRRAAVLSRHRARGASLPAIAVSLLVESLALAAAGGATGLLIAALVIRGAPSWPWLLPVLAVVAFAGPVLGTRAARASDGRRRPADRRQRRTDDRGRTVRRAALEASIALLAVAGMTALHQRGVTAGSGAGADLLLSGAPALVALAVALLAYRALPAILIGTLAAARRSRGAGPLLAAARAQAAGAAALPFVALVLATTLLSFGATLTQTIRSGQVTGSWDTVGADVQVRTEADPDGAATAHSLLSAGGVQLATAARVDDLVQIFGARDQVRVRVLAVDPAAYQQLLATTPPADAPQLAKLTGTPTPGAPVPALVSLDLLGEHGPLSLLWQGHTIPITAVGVAPQPASALSASASADQLQDTVVVSSPALALAAGEPVEANTFWITGAGADAAVASLPAWTEAATVTSRAQWLAARSTEPLTSGLILLVASSIVLLLAFAVITVVLAASASAPGRATTQATLRVLGLRLRATTAVALGELAPSVLVACVSGLILGASLAAALIRPLALRLVTGQASTPALVLPWWALAVLALLAGTVAVVVAVESSTRRRERLGQVLRVGSS
ncbi:MAG: ABC transporter permease [Cellulomonas sp.]